MPKWRLIEILSAKRAYTLWFGVLQLFVSEGKLQKKDNGLPE